jgi:signal transduction histidine kinase/FixJ family two-component response regulator
MPVARPVPEVAMTHVLIVDDDVDNVETFEDKCPGLGWNCSTALTRADAEAKIGQIAELDACILDMRLNDGTRDGLEVFRALKAKFPDVPVVLLAGDDRNAPEALWAGVSLFVQKPVGMQHLPTLVKALIDTRRVLGKPADTLKQEIGLLTGYLENMGDGVCVLDENAIVRHLNRAMIGDVKFTEADKGKPVTEAVGGRYFGDLVAESDRTRWIDEVEFKDRHYHVTTCTSRHPDDLGRRFVMTWTDITKRKRAVALLDKLTAMAATPIDCMADDLVQAVCGIGYGRAYLYLHEDDGEGNSPLVCYAAYEGKSLKPGLKLTVMSANDPYVQRVESSLRVVRLTQSEVDTLRRDLPDDSPRPLDGVTGMLKIPLNNEAQRLGILCVESVVGWPAFDGEDENLMDLLARGLADAILGSLNAPNKAAKERWEKPLGEINRVLSEDADLPRVLELVLRHAGEGLGADFAWLQLNDESGGKNLRPRAHWKQDGFGIDSDYLRTYQHPNDVGIISRCIRQDKIQVVTDMKSDPDFLKCLAVVRNDANLAGPWDRLVSAVCLPVRRGNTVLGAFGIYFTRHFEPTDMDLKRLDEVTNLLAVALRRMDATAAVLAEAVEKTKAADLLILHSGLAHTLRKQLAELRTCLDLALEADDEPTVRHYVEAAGESERRMMKRIEAIIDWIKPEGLTPREVHLEEVIDKIVDVLGEELEQDGIILNRDNPHPDCVAFGPPGAYKMAVLDLFVNAINELKQATAVNDKHIRVALRDAVDRPEFVELRIEDNGRGMPKDQVDVFRKFDRPHGTEAGGVGLGLYLAHRFIKDAGGTIDFDPDHTPGTAVVLQLPKADKGPRT